MPAILATLIFSALATVPAVVPGFVPGTVPGSTPALTPSTPAAAAISVGPGFLVPGLAPTAPLFTPGTFAPAPGGIITTAPASIPVVVNTIPTTTPANVPGLVPGSVPAVVVAVPGVIPAAVPGFAPALVAPGTPQPGLTPAIPTTPILPGVVPSPSFIAVASATGVACVPCTAQTGTTNYEGRTLTWSRTCAACAVTNFIASFTSSGCAGLVGDDLHDCCRAGLRDSICGVWAVGRPINCNCNGNIIACPDCDHSKKGLLGLLGLLGLIPLLLCCSLLLCLLWLCCIRGTKKGPETHFATYQPQAMAMPTVVEHCAPVASHCAPVATHCDLPYGGVTTCA